PLVLATAAAGTGIVATDLDGGPLSSSGAILSLAVGGSGGHRPRPGDRLSPWDDVVNTVDDVVVDRVEQRLPHLMRFTLILAQRIALTVGPYPNALPQIVDSRQVLDPELIDDPQRPGSFDRPHQLGTELLLPRVVGLLGQLDQPGYHELTVRSTALVR